jgi:hypothetical protein
VKNALQEKRRSTMVLNLKTDDTTMKNLNNEFLMRYNRNATTKEMPMICVEKKIAKSARRKEEMEA